MRTIANVALKLTLILGVVECVGFIRIPNQNLSEEIEIFNATFNLIYTVVRSFRGVSLCIVFIFKNKIRQLYRKCLKTNIWCKTISITPNNGNSSC